ncbi:hypothetical protein FGO68_gene3010 [Halteria grandinella]|uniref:Uncharacterized protein n=1 Tax=Halteria grandinella TaxID=5974 RepID=A0A8J8T9C2_HALGN|nr:hypothetical protein FGO68_gene3010 [Halteria grandinella]
MEEKYLECKNMLNKQDNEVRTLQGQVQTLTERRTDVEQAYSRIVKENEELRRRLETAKNNNSTPLDFDPSEDAVSGFEDECSDSIVYQERFAYSLEHLTKVTQLIMLDNSIFHDSGYYFATSDSQGQVKLWDLDCQSESIQTFSTAELHYENQRDALRMEPQGVRDITQIGRHLVCAFGNAFEASSLVSWNLVSCQQSTLVVSEAHKQEINALCKVMFGTEQIIASGGSDAWVKLWEIEDSSENGCNAMMQVGEVELQGGENDRVSCMLGLTQSEVYKDHLIVFTEMKHFYLFSITLREDKPKKNEDNINLLSQEDMQDIDELPFQLTLIKRFTSKHLAHTLVPLAYPGGLLTMSRESLEFWDLKSLKRKRVLSTCYGQIEHGCVLSESYKQPAQSNGDTQQPEDMLNNDDPIYNVRIITSEDSRILRLWSHKQHLKNLRIVTKHNDIITRVLKVPGKHFLVTAAADGSVKCFVGKRQVGKSYSLKDIVTNNVIL